MSIKFRNPAFDAKAAFGGLWGSAAGLTTAVASATGLPAIDVTAVEAGKRFEGVKVDIPVRVVQLDSGQSLTVGVKVQHSSASGTGFADLGDTGYTETVLQNATTATGVQTDGVASVSRSLVGAKKFIRVAARRQGSAADTGGDIEASAFSVNFFGPSESPA